MTPSMERTRELCRGSDTCDALFNIDSPEAEKRILDTPEGLLLPGSRGDEYCDDLLITPEGDGWHLCYHDPEGTDQPLWGRVWQDAGHYDCWNDLVSFAYTL